PHRETAGAGGETALVQRRSRPRGTHHGLRRAGLRGRPRRHLRRGVHRRLVQRRGNGGQGGAVRQEGSETMGEEKWRSTVLARLEWTALALLLAGLVMALRFLPVRAALERAALWIESLGWWAPAAFVALYVLCVLLLVPRTVLTVAAGFLFGFGEGALWALLSINLGANLAFLSG